MALMGFSQGAQVIADTLCGRSEANWFGNAAAFTGAGSKKSTLFLGFPYNFKTTDLLLQSLLPFSWAIPPMSQAKPVGT